MLALCGQIAKAQTAPADPEPGTVEKPARSVRFPSVEETQPPLYYLEDKDGNLQAVPGFRFEDFQELYKFKQGLEHRDKPPGFTMKEISASGKATEEQAELTIVFRVLVHEDGWIRVPLGLGRAALREEARYDGPGKAFLQFDETDEGYLGWFRGRSEEEHQLTLKLLVSLERAADETRLRLPLPPSVISRLTLTVPLADASAKVSSEAKLEPPASETKGTTTLKALGLGRDFTLAWYKASGRASATPTVLEVNGAILARLDDQSVHTEASLTVRSFGTPVDQFRVRLPERAELVTGQYSGYTVTPVAEKTSGDKQPVPLVDVRLNEKTTGPVEIRLATRQLRDPKTPAEWFELAGFEVVGAARQSGHLAVVMSGNWHMVRGPSRGVRQVEELPKALRRENLVAGFEYFSQPCSLTVRVVPRKTRMTVEPEYLLLVDADQVRLEAKLKYTIRGAKAYGLGIKLPGWHFDEVGPESLVAVDGAELDPSELLSVSLLQPSTGQLEITLKAHQAIPKDAKSLVLALPQPQATSLGPAAVVVLPADNIELIPDTKNMVGLIRQQVAPEMALPKRQQEHLYYRGDASEAVFAAGFRVHPRQVQVDVTTRIQLQRDSGLVEQKLDYTIAHEPLDKLAFRVPRSLLGAKGLEIEMDGQKLAPLFSPNLPEDSEPVEMRLTLPGARIGLCSLLIRYPLEAKEMLPKTSIIRGVPLIMPTDGELLGNRAFVEAPPAILVKPRDEVWTEQREEATRPGRHPGLKLVASERASELILALHQNERETLGSTIVQRAWIQTWRTRSARQDRAVFRFLTTHKNLELIMPAGTVLGKMIVLLDGKSADWQATPENHVVIPLGAGTATSDSTQGHVPYRSHLLELQYHFPEQALRGGWLSMELPRLDREAWVRRMYWQLILPRDEDVVFYPEGLTNEFHWGWNGTFWGREPLLDQQELEAWAGVPSRDAPGPSSNQYLFSSFGQISECTLCTAGRAWIVLIASGVALVAGLLIIYVPTSRHPATLLVLTVFLLSAGIVYPEPTLLFAQAAVLGLALTLLAGLLERGVARRRRAVSARETSSSVLDRDSTQTQYRPPLVSTPSSTETAAAAPPPSPYGSRP